MESLGDPRPEDSFSGNSFLFGLRVAFRPRAARGLDVTYEIRIEDSVFNVRVANGRLELADGPAESPDVTIETDLGLGALLRGEITAAEARKRKGVQLRGDAALLDRFAELFRLTGGRAHGSSLPNGHSSRCNESVAGRPPKFGFVPVLHPAVTQFLHTFKG